MIRTMIVAREIPAEARRPCADPVSLPERDITQREVTSFWGKDRAALRTCEARRAAAVAGGAP